MKMTLKESLGFAVLSLLMPCLLLCLQAGCATRPRVASELERLQGAWEGVESPLSSQFMGPESASTGKVSVTIIGNSLHFHRDNDNWFVTAFTLPTGTVPRQLHATVKAAAEAWDAVGQVIFVFYKIEDGTLTLAGLPSRDEPPPKRSKVFSFEDKSMFRYELRKLQKKNAEASRKPSAETSKVASAAAQSPVPNVEASPPNMHAAEVAKIASGPDLFPTPIVFQNNNAGLRKVYWLDKNGERKPYCELKPGEKCEIGTYLGHPWVVTDADGNALALYCPDGQKRTVTLE
jgi:hypothetical protein